MDFEKELQRVAKQYEDEGYAVTIRPDADKLPPFAKGFAVDLLATRARENVLVSVKRDRAELEADPKVSRQAEVAGAQPGWRYDVVILEPERSPSPARISRAVDRADRAYAGRSRARRRRVAPGRVRAGLGRSGGGHAADGSAPASGAESERNR